MASVAVVLPAHPEHTASLTLLDMIRKTDIFSMGLLMLIMENKHNLIVIFFNIGLLITVTYMT